MTTNETEGGTGIGGSKHESFAHGARAQLYRLISENRNADYIWIERQMINYLLDGINQNDLINHDDIIGVIKHQVRNDWRAWQNGQPEVKKERKTRKTNADYVAISEAKDIVIRAVKTIERVKNIAGLRQANNKLTRHNTPNDIGSLSKNLKDFRKRLLARGVGQDQEMCEVLTDDEINEVFFGNL
jgi:hypothetical protein